MTIEHNRVYLPEGQPRAVLLLLQCLHQPQGGAPHRHTSENIATITCSLVETRSTSSDTHTVTHTHTHTHTHTLHWSLCPVSFCQLYTPPRSCKYVRGE